MLYRHCYMEVWTGGGGGGGDGGGMGGSGIHYSYTIIAITTFVLIYTLDFWGGGGMGGVWYTLFIHYYRYNYFCPYIHPRLLGWVIWYFFLKLFMFISK